MKRVLGRAGVVLALLLSSFATLPAANAATTYSFTNAGATGAAGPTQAQVNAAYSGTNLASTVTINTRGIQEWVVPASGNYQIDIAGAAGGNGSSYTGGYGAVVSINVPLTSGTRYAIVVGQKGSNFAASSYPGGGGGGGSFMYQLDTTSYVAAIAGGGGGASISKDLQTTQSTAHGKYASTDGTSVTGKYIALGGTNGSGGGVSNRAILYGGPGAGVSSDGATSLGGQGRSRANGWIGGSGNGSSPAPGGFGGGGSAGSETGGPYGWAGGGGGYSGGAAGWNGGDGDGQYGGGGGSYYTGSLSSGSDGGNTGNGYVTITSLGPSLITFAPRTTLTNSTSITYDITFSEAVTGLATADFSKSGSGASSCTIGSPSGSGTTYTIQLTGCTPGAVILTMASGAVTNGSSQTAPSTNTAAVTVTIDQTAPTISSLTAPANGTYIPTNTPTFTLAFSESVTVTGTPRLTLTVGALTKYATFVSLSDSKTATFRYTVATAAGEFDADGIAVATSLDLNGGAIADLATNAISNLSFTAPTLTSVLVAQKPGSPTIGTITPASAQLSVAFTTGDSNGSAISNYEYSTDNGANWKARATGTTASPLLISTISGSASALSNGTAYNVRIRAVNAAGAGDSSTAVSATPSAVIVSGDATLTLTYGNSASTGTYTSTGGTAPYTYTLSSAVTGVSISAGVVTASSSTPAGSYTRNVISTDSGSQTGTKALTITVNKAAPTISIALPGGASSAAIGGAVVITATVSQAGAVNFRLAGTSIVACSAVASSAGSATCSWTPGALGGAALTAVLTPTDSNNYESATTTTLNIAVVNGITTLALSLAGGVTSAPKGQTILITASVDQVGRITFFVDGKRIARCVNLLVSGASRTCSWKPAVQKAVKISARIVPTNSAFNPATSNLAVQVIRRSGTR